LSLEYLSIYFIVYFIFLFRLDTKLQKLEHIYKIILKSGVPPLLSQENTNQLLKIQNNLKINTDEIDNYFDNVFEGNCLISTKTGNARFVDHLKRVVYTYEMINNIHPCILQNKL